MKKVAKIRAQQGKKAKDQILGKDAADLLGCSMALIYQMRRDGRLTSGSVEGKHLYFDKSEILKVKESGKVHPRTGKGRHKLGTGDIVNVHQENVQFEVNCATTEYNILSMILAPQKISVAEWCAKMVESAAATAQQSMTQNIAISVKSGGKKTA